MVFIIHTTNLEFIHFKWCNQVNMAWQNTNLTIFSNRMDKVGVVVVFKTIWSYHLYGHLCHIFTSLVAHSFSFSYYILNWAYATEGIFWKIVIFTFKDFFKATNGFSNWYIRTWLTCKLFSNVKVL